MQNAKLQTADAVFWELIRSQCGFSACGGGKFHTRDGAPPGGPGRSRQGSAGPASGRRVGRWLRGPAKKRPRAQPAERGAGAADGGGPGGAGCGTSRAPGTGMWAGRRAPRLPVSPPSLRPAPSPSPRHLSPHLSLASRPAVRASAGAFPPPGSRHLTCGCSPRPPAEPRARQPSRPRASRRGGSSHGALRMQTPRHARLLPRVRTVPAMGHGRRSSLSRSREQISAHETRIYEESVAEWLSRCSGVVKAPKASGSKSLPEAPEGHSGWSQADCGVSRAGCSASAASPRGPPSLPPGFARKPPHPPGRP